MKVVSLPSGMPFSHGKRSSKKVENVLIGCKIIVKFPINGRRILTRTGVCSKMTNGG